MPIYEYQCEVCHKRSEILQKLSDSPLSECPHCQGPVRKLISTAGLHFKGSGWYVTDYAKKSGEPSSDSNDSKKDSKVKKKEESSSVKEKSSSKPSSV